MDRFQTLGMVLDENWFWFDSKHLKTQRKQILDTLKQESKRGGGFDLDEFGSKTSKLKTKQILK